MAKVGRKGWKHELQFKEIGKLAARVIEKALSASDEEVSFDKKCEIAKFLYAKYIPKDINITNDGLNDTIHDLIKEVRESVSKDSVTSLVMDHGNRIHQG